MKEQAWRHFGKMSTAGKKVPALLKFDKNGKILATINLALYHRMNDIKALRKERRDAYKHASGVLNLVDKDARKYAIDKVPIEKTSNSLSLKDIKKEYNQFHSSIWLIKYPDKAKRKIAAGNQSASHKASQTKWRAKPESREYLRAFDRRRNKVRSEAVKIANRTKVSAKYKEIKHSAVRRGIAWDITKEVFETLCFRPCYYCNSSETASLHSAMGLDRVDNSKCYTLDNVVTACARCNMSKGKKDVREYWASCKAVATKDGSGKNATKYTTLRSKLGSYKYCARKRKKEFCISDELAKQLMSSNCYYCDAPPIPLSGIDRKLNSRGYVDDNVVSCCTTCNFGKLTMDGDEYISLCKRVYLTHPCGISQPAQ